MIAIAARFRRSILQQFAFDLNNPSAPRSMVHNIYLAMTTTNSFIVAPDDALTVTQHEPVTHGDSGAPRMKQESFKSNLVNLTGPTLEGFLVHADQLVSFEQYTAKKCLEDGLILYMCLQSRSSRQITLSLQQACSQNRYYRNHAPWVTWSIEQSTARTCWPWYDVGVP